MAADDTASLNNVLKETFAYGFPVTGIVLFLLYLTSLS
jgi:hypothetical protein